MSKAGTIAAEDVSVKTAFDVVFVHGLMGDSKSTWSNTENEYWPDWITIDIPEACIHSIEYPSNIFEKWAKKEMGLHERAVNILEGLVSKGIGQRPVVFVCHSLGGLLTKEILRVANESQDEDWRKLALNTKLVCFLATPHTGASLASIIRSCIPRMSSNIIDALANDNGYLSSLGHAYRDLATANGIKTVSYYEKYKTAGVAIVVNPESADPGAADTRPIAVDADHVSICKPKDREDLVYASICRRIGKVASEAKCSIKDSTSDDSFAAPDYAAASTLDRRDLLQKLMDAGREHEYQRANDLQNKFVQRYHRLGLYTEAKTKSDTILSSVEQRFITHVYNAKILKDATHDEISEALQTHVIDALCNGQAGAQLSPASVLQALYYLTEQCHIQWDKP